MANPEHQETPEVGGGPSDLRPGHHVRLSALGERFHQSLFFFPALFIVAAIALAVVMVFVDRAVSTESLPGFLTTTVESSRSILGAISAGTITAASVVLSLTLVAVQLSSSQHSPRVLRNFIGDRFQQMVIGVVMGTFVYCVFVLRVVRAPLEEGGSPFVPNLSVVVAIVLGIAALLAVLASVDSTARGLKVESIANQVTNETIAVIGERFPMKGEQLLVTKLQDPEATMARLDRRDADAVLVVRSPEAGWVRQIASDALLAAAPAGATIQTLISAGTYVMEETPILSVLDIDVPDDDEAEHMSRELCAAIDFGNERTMQQDVDFGVLRLSDIGLRALSSGVNDPNTAVEIVVRLGSVLRALLGRDLSGEQSDDDGRTLISIAAADYGSYVHAAFDPMREAADNQISVYEAMLRTLGQLVDQAGLIDDAEASEGIHEAGAEIFERATKCDLLPRERERLQSVAELAGFVPAR